MQLINFKGRQNLPARPNQGQRKPTSTQQDEWTETKEILKHTLTHLVRNKVQPASLYLFSIR